MRISRFITILVLTAALLPSGCATDSQIGEWQGPQNKTGAQQQQWAYQGQNGRTLNTPHYRIHTTIQDDETVELLPQVMEGAWSMYREISPDIAPSDKPMYCYMFRSRNEWDSFTQQHTGQDAKIYLQIRSGGYTIADTYVAYYIGRSNTFSVASHEGFHQYCGRHFKGRLPPFLEEGLCCMFEWVSWQSGLPRWNLSINPQRAQSLRNALDKNCLWSLDKLITTHAGDIVGERMDKIDAFYAQSWAFARFLWEGENGKYRPALQRWLAETADGTVRDPTHSHSMAGMPWNRRAVKPMIEYYLGVKLEALEPQYQAFLRRIAYDELGAQWRADAGFTPGRQDPPEKKADSASPVAPKPTETHANAND